MIGERNIGAGEFFECYIDGAERDRAVRLDIGLDAEALCGFGDLAAPHAFGHLHGDGVDRLCQRFGNSHGAGEAFGVVGRLPSGDVDGLVDESSARRHATFHGRDIDERFERRARLAL